MLHAYVWLTMQERLGIAQPQDLEEAADISSKMNTRLWPSRDAEGFRKEILALSRYGRASIYNISSFIENSLMWRQLL